MEGGEGLLEEFTAGLSAKQKAMLEEKPLQLQLLAKFMMGAETPSTLVVPKKVLPNIPQMDIEHMQAPKPLKSSLREKNEDAEHPSTTQTPKQRTLSWSGASRTGEKVFPLSPSVSSAVTTTAPPAAAIERGFSSLFEDGSSSDEEEGGDAKGANGDDSFVDDPRVPRMSALILNRGGSFAPSTAAHHGLYDGFALETQRSSSSSTAGGAFSGKSDQRSKSGIEDSVMDRARVVSYVEISSREKQDVFQLPAVRRSMRKLDEGEILMSEHVLKLSQKFMEMAPSRASLLHIGWDSMQEGCQEKSLMDEMNYISPTFGKIARLRYTKHMFVVNMIAGLCEAACKSNSRRTGRRTTNQRQSHSVFSRGNGIHFTDHVTHLSRTLAPLPPLPSPPLLPSETTSYTCLVTVST